MASYKSVIAPNANYVDFMWIFQVCRVPLQYLESKGTWNQLFAGDILEYLQVHPKEQEK